MATLKCKMCGGELQLTEDENICECEFCGSRQTVPTVDDDKKQKLYDRANKLRFNCDFDRAADAYEKIVNEFPDDAESYWGLILCKYGIEYVDDPVTGKKVPTCHRSSFDSVMEDADFDMVMENAEPDARSLYRTEAKQIEEIRRGILEVSGKEAPYDIFICYKETDEIGNRTIDSVLAQDIYDALTDKGYRVFFSRISLEDKLGTEYEPYIFAALNSAKLMLAFGTSYDNYNAVWVKNEWSRFVKLMASDKEKYLIPCYKDIDAYDIPKEFAKFQAQDLGKVGATQDLLRGIDKIFGKDKASQKAAQATAAAQAGADSGMTALNAQTAALLKRGFMALDDGEFDKANGFFEQVLNNDAECGQAYWGKALAAKHARNAADMGKAVFKKIEDAKTTVPVELPEPDLAVLAKEADKDGLLKGISDDELRSLLKDLRKQVNYDDTKPYYEKVLSSIDEQKVTGYVGNRDYERALQYADASIHEGKDKILAEVKEKLQTSIAAEEKKAEQAKAQDVQNRDLIRSTIEERLAHVAADVEAEKIKYETAKAEAEKKAEADYQAALAKKAEFQGKIAQLESEKNNVKGLFAGKKKKEIDDNIEALKKSIDAIAVPADPGKMPVKGDEPRREEFKAVPSGKVEDPLIMVKCALSPEYKKQLEEKRLRDRQEYLKKKLNAFGSYAYDATGEKKAIAWKILEWRGEQALIISKEVIDVVKYNETYVDITWEKCTLRRWLNNEFLNKAFSKEERECILQTQVSADKNPYYSTDPGAATEDKIFLLSIPEAEKYFKSDEERQIKPTPYAKKKGAYTDDKTGNACWWLRSPGDNSRSAARVYTGGSVGTLGDFVHNGDYCIRPALWLDLSNLKS